MLCRLSVRGEERGARQQLPARQEKATHCPEQARDKPDRKLAMSQPRRMILPTLAQASMSALTFTAKPTTARIASNSKNTSAWRINSKCAATKAVCAKCVHTQHGWEVGTSSLSPGCGYKIERTRRPLTESKPVRTITARTPAEATSAFTRSCTTIEPPKSVFLGSAAFGAQPAAVGCFETTVASPVSMASLTVT